MFKKLFNYFQQRRDENIRERCVKYASAYPDKWLHINEAAELAYHFVKNNKTDSQTGNQSTEAEGV